MLKGHRSVMDSTIYLDNQATTPTDPRVRDSMLPFLSPNAVGNPHSVHFAGRRAALAVEQARGEIAALIGAEPEEIVFTSGATEANNIALQGIARSPGRRGNHVVTCATEHPSVLETAAHLSRSGFQVEVLPIGSNGLIDIEQLADAITSETALVTIMAVNNEIGVLQPIHEIAALCRARDVVFHTDAAQATGKVTLNVKEIGVDLMSLSGHKIYAPIGVGALYVSEESPVVPEPLFWGGGQERGLRSGTVAPHLCIALGTASAIAQNEMESDAVAAAAQRDRFLEIVRARLPGVQVNAAGSPRVSGNLSLTLPGVDGDRLVGALQPWIAMSTNSACSSGALRPSHVLTALGLTEEEAASTIRIGFGRFNVLPEIEAAAEQLASVAEQILESESPRYAAAV